MHTFIFSRDLEETPKMFDLASKMTQVTDCLMITGVLFQLAPYFESRLHSIPIVNMWVGNEIAFLEYCEIMTNDLHTVSVAIGEAQAHKLADRARRALAPLREAVLADPKWNMTNPVARVSDDFIHQNWVEFVRGRPDCASMRPDVIDFSVPFKYDWSV